MFDETTGPQLVAQARRGDLRALGTLLGDLVTRLDTLSEAEITFLDGVVAGTVSASKSLVVDANKDIATLRNLGLSGILTIGAATIQEIDVVHRSVTALSLANLQALAATPIEVVPAPAAGKFIQVLAWRFRLIFVTTAIDDAAADGNLTLEYDGGSVIDAMEADGLVDAGANTQGISNVLTELIAAESGIDGTAVVVSNDGAEFTIVGVGDSTAEVEVFYRVLDVDPS
jgi:hypothetical protein